MLEVDFSVMVSSGGAAAAMSKTPGSPGLLTSNF